MNIKFSKYNFFYLISFLSNFLIATNIFGLSLEAIANYTIPVLLLLAYIYKDNNKESSFTRTEEQLIFLFFCPIILSLFGVIPNTILMSDKAYSPEYMFNGILRLVNYIINLFIILYGFHLTKAQNILNIKWFYASLLVFLSFGLWQYLHFSFGIPIIPFETRDALHSIADNFGIHRITSIAREPSFFAPLLVETLLLTSFLIKLYPEYRKVFLVIIGLVSFVSIFTLSPSVYAEFCLLGMVILLRSKNFISTFILLSLIAIIVIFNIDFLEKYIIPRFMEVSGSTRFLQLKTVVNTFFNFSVFTIFVGCGPKSLSYLSTITKIDGSNEALHHSTNNIFIDLLVDNGIIGIIGLVFFYFILFRRSILVKSSNIPILYCTHFFIYNQYRGEYVSPRFAIQVLILLFLISFYSTNKSKFIKFNEINS